MTGLCKASISLAWTACAFVVDFAGRKRLFSSQNLQQVEHHHAHANDDEPSADGDLPRPGCTTELHKFPQDRCGLNKCEDENAKARRGGIGCVIGSECPGAERDARKQYPDNFCSEPGVSGHFSAPDKVAETGISIADLPYAKISHKLHSKEHPVSLRAEHACRNKRSGLGRSKDGVNEYRYT